MLLKCSFVLLLAGLIGGAEYYSNPFASSLVTTSCPYPTIEHGRARVKQRTRLVKFMCAPRYELVGNRYATCRSGQWDVPMPVCVKPSCAPFQPSLNAIQVKEHHEAWVVTFCLPGYKLKGSSVVYCNGYKWNDTAPVCVDTSEKAALSCDFEDASICGWTQDELHDFDWRRWNLKTPSSMLATGPSHDHTPGTHGQGYYMYIESTSEIKNSTARLLSPIYDSSLTADGCFSFFYHMFGRDIGGLRVYQKPDSVQLFDLLNVTSNNSKYVLFQMWGNQGNEWYNNVLKLVPMDEDFQIVIEGIRGATFISDIAIDDVSVLQGNECTAAQLAASTPPPPTPADQLQTCKGRCDQDYRNPNSSVRLCGCSISCLITRNCCPDFLDICLDGEESDPVPSSTETLPQTQKLVGETTTAKPTTASTPTNTDTNPITSTTAKPITSTKSTATAKPSITTRFTTTAKPTTTSKPTTISKPTPTAKPISSNPNPIPKPKPTTSKQISTLKPTIPTKLTTTAKPIVKFTTTIKPRVTTTTAPMLVDDSEIEKKKQETEVNLNKMEIRVLNTQEKSSSTWKTAVITITVLALSVALIFLAVTARSARGRVAIARLRGRSNNDSEVRYLNTADDDDL